MKQEENEQKNSSSKSMLRTALLNWYPFQNGKRALLVGSNTRPLHNLLERYFNTVDIVDAGDCQFGHLRIPCGAGYDCIVAADLVEMSKNVRELLRQLYDMLTDDGVLLLAFRNRFGLKYLCGGTDKYSETPFATLQPAGRGQRLYARREMEAMLCDAGFAEPRCYFMMPDADYVQAVYTEDYLPNDSIRDRVFPFDLHDSPLVAWEGDLYDDMVREGTLPYTANVYLEECRKPGASIPGKQVVYAALSTDRGTEHGFATVLYSDRTACKLPLGPEGLRPLEYLCNNMEILKTRGILTVEHEMTDDGIIMPLVQEEGLLHFLRRQLPDNPDVFLSVFDRIYQDVLQSSPVSAEQPKNLSEIWGAENEKLAPVLETAWIDMIPYNAFWADGRIRYYDQEFVVQNCPAKYVLFRALRYTWLHIPEVESVLSLELVKERFGLTELWDGFQHREDLFVAKNRNYNDFKEIYDHAWPDRVAMAQRREALGPFALLRTVHAVQMELLKELDRVCKENDLKYMAIHGTLLGAVRHHGFIPWDDDVDIAMPREDYDKLLALGNGILSTGFFLQTPRNNYGCFYGGYCKLRRDGTAALEPQNQNKAWNNCHQGIWIDIFPLDNCPENIERQKRVQRHLSWLQRIVYAKAYSLPQFVPRDVPGSRVSIYYLLAKCTRRRWLLQQIDNTCRKQNDSPLRGILACYYGNYRNNNVWLAEAVDEVVEIPFEDMLLPVPVGWDEILRARYGDDYMCLPPREKRYRHNNVVFYTAQKGSENGT